MICPGCNATVADGAKFCPRCGNQFQQMQEPLQPLPQQYQAAGQPKKNRKGLIIALIIVGALGLIAVVCAGVLIFRNSQMLQNGTDPDAMVTIVPVDRTVCWNENDSAFHLPGDCPEPDHDQMITIGTVEEAQQLPVLEGTIVYWTEQGTLAHLYVDCPHLNHSDVMCSGTVEQALNAGKDRQCKTCEERAITEAEFAIISETLP